MTRGGGGRGGAGGGGRERGVDQEQHRKHLRRPLQARRSVSESRPSHAPSLPQALSPRGVSDSDATRIGWTRMGLTRMGFGDSDTVTRIQSGASLAGPCRRACRCGQTLLECSTYAAELSVDRPGHSKGQTLGMLRFDRGAAGGIQMRRRRGAEMCGVATGSGAGHAEARSTRCIRVTGESRGPAGGCWRGMPARE